MGILKPEWAKKVSPNLIRRLYETDARGIVDDELIDEAGWGLWQRCGSILEVTAAHYGNVCCLQCREMIRREDAWSENEQVSCPACGWQIAWKEYHQSYRGKQLFGANSVEEFETYHAHYPHARTSRKRMLLIDQLIHSFHLSVEKGIGRPSAANLIEGSLREVIRFLDGLSSGDASAAQLQDSHSAWRATLDKAEWAKIFLEGK